MKVGREAVLAYRIAAQGLRRDATSPQALAILGLGVQNTPPGSARLACAARLPSVPVDFAGLRIAWTYRLSPHLHHDADLPGVAAALWPATEADAVSRLNWPSARLAGTGMSATEVIEQATDAVLDVLTEPMTKGAASAAVTERVDESLTMWCKACQSTHIYDSLFRLAAGLAGAWLDTEARPDPAHADAGLVASGARSGEAHRPGPGLTCVFSARLACRRRRFPQRRQGRSWPKNWPGDLVEVEVDGANGLLPAGGRRRAAHAAGTAARPVAAARRPVPASPRPELIVPDAKAQKVLWRVLGNPGAVLVDGEIVGAWRAKAARQAALEFQFEPFDELPSDLAPLLDEEARLIATARGISDATVSVGTRR